MAAILKLFTVLMSLICFVKGQSTCTALNGVNATCKSLHECSLLQQIMEKKHIKMLNDTQCGNTKVCCPDPCYTPEGKEGNCVDIKSCLPLARLLKENTNDYYMQYVQDSRCNSTEKYSVCCPLKHPTVVVQRGNCESTLSAYPPDPITGCCGTDNIIGNKITGGVATKIDEYPWLVLIEYSHEGVVGVLCGGSLISARYVLTAAHCVAGRILEYGTPTSVRLGEYDTEQEGPDCARVEGAGTDCTDGTVIVPIETTMPHPGYRPIKHSPNDIALIKMKSNAPYNTFIRPICLPSEDLIALAPSRLTNLTAAGWGATSNNTSSNVKQQVDLQLVGRDLCDPVYKSVGTNITTTGSFCAGGEPGKDTCMGDSGGPLMYENGRVYEAIGIVSFGPKPCGQPMVPGVYTRVHSYLPWIKSTILESYTSA